MIKRFFSVIFIFSLIVMLVLPATNSYAADVSVGESNQTAINGAPAPEIDIKYNVLSYSDFEWQVLDDKTIEILKYTGEKTDVTVPSEIDGYTVTRIGGTGKIIYNGDNTFETSGEGAFMDNENIRSVTLPDTVREIGTLAFKGCSNLTSITFPESLERIEEYAFAECGFTDSIIIPANVNYIGDCAFYNLPRVNRYRILSRKIRIGRYPIGSVGGWHRVVVEPLPDIIVEVFDPDTEITDYVHKINDEIEDKDDYWSLIPLDNPTYTIRYNLGGGSATGNPTTYTARQLSIKINNPYRSGYIFIGWTGSNGFTPQKNLNIPKGTLGNLTYTAHWERNSSDSDDDEDDDDEDNDDGTSKSSAPSQTHFKKIKHYKCGCYLDINWKKISSASGYNFQYATDKKFKTAENKWVKDSSKTKVTLADLTKNKMYYIRIRVYKIKNGKKVFSDWVGYSTRS